MRKIILLIIFTTIFISCNSKNTGVLEPAVNPYSGDWVLNYYGDAVGAATVGVQTNSVLENGIMLDSMSTGVIFRIDIFGTVNDDTGELSASLKFFKDNNSVGTMTGTFKDSANGSYVIYYPDSLSTKIDTLKGTWTAEYFD